MPGAADIETAVRTIVEAAFPSATCFVRRGSAVNGIWGADMTYPCFAFDLNDDRPTEMLYAGTKKVTYTGTLAYLTVELPGARDVAPATGSAPQTGSTIEATIDAAADLFIAPRTTAGKPGLQGVPELVEITVKTLKPYDKLTDNKTVNVSRVQITFKTAEVL